MSQAPYLMCKLWRKSMTMKTCTIYTTCDGFAIQFDMQADPEWSDAKLDSEAYKRFDTDFESVGEIRHVEWH